MHVSVSPGPERTQETQEFRSPQLWSEFEAISKKHVWKDFLLEQPLEGKAEEGSEQEEQRHPYNCVKKEAQRGPGGCLQVKL